MIILKSNRPYDTPESFSINNLKELIGGLTLFESSITKSHYHDTATIKTTYIDEDSFDRITIRGFINKNKLQSITITTHSDSNYSIVAIDKEMEEELKSFIIIRCIGNILIQTVPDNVEFIFEKTHS